MPAKNKTLRFKDVIKWIIFSTNVIAILLLFCAFLSWNVSPLKTNLFSYIGLGFGFIFLINILYLIFWISFSKWRLVIISLSAIIICYKPVTTFFPFHLHSPKPPSNAIKILTYNVQGFPTEGNRKAKEQPILNYIANTDADIVCLQEYMVSKTGLSLISQRDVNRILNKYPYRSISSLESSGKYHTFGLACFSKFPIEHTHEIVFESSYNGATVYTININGERYNVANVHLESNNITQEDKKLYSDFLQNTDSVRLDQVTSNIRTRLGKSYRARVNQVDIVKRHLASQQTRGVIICGDFNDTPISYAYNQMRKGLKDSFVSTSSGPGITYHKDLFLFRIDYILHSENMQAYRTKVDKIKHSDHYPLRTWIELEPQHK